MVVHLRWQDGAAVLCRLCSDLNDIFTIALFPSSGKVQFLCGRGTARGSGSGATDFV